MRRRRLFWQLYPSHLLMALIPLMLLCWYGVHSFSRLYHRVAVRNLAYRAQLLDEEGRTILLNGEKGPGPSCKDIARRAGARLTIILTDGHVICDSNEDPALMDNHADRPEVIDALAGRTEGHIRYSHTLEKNMLYVAQPIHENGKTIGLLRLSVPMTELDDALNSTYLHLLFVISLLIILAAMASLYVTRRISRPLEALNQGAQRYSRGDLGFQLHVSASQEIEALAESLNRMAAQLDDRIHHMLQQRNEQEAVLSSMVEGVLAVDNKECLINLNQTAARLFGLEVEHAMGRNIHTVIRNSDLQEFLLRIQTGQKHIEGEILLMEENARHLQAHGTVLRDPQGRNIGALVVLNDVTRLKRLEEMRRDFVANVSHELRTPITSIKGFVETLLDGAIDNPNEARRFLEIVARHADRLNAIIEDLLSLSKIEQEAEKAEIKLERGPVLDVLRAAIQSCESKAAEKDIQTKLQCEKDVTAAINPTLLEQAVVNLIDNAIKYSDPGKSIEIVGAQTENGITIQVRDQGSGIPKEHLPRLFERFYRVDKARSRKLGGTGLGLAIAKHIVLAHNGNITVESKLGEGSIFTITLPIS